MSLLPETSITRYLTGTTALNIPDRDGNVADWHFTEIFLCDRRRFMVNGVDLPDTVPFLGQYGIRECSEILRKHGVPTEEGAKVFAADFCRALVDLIYKSAAAGRVPTHLSAGDFLDSVEERNELSRALAALKANLEDGDQVALIEKWEAT